MAPKNWFCESCQKQLGKRSKTCPSLWCQVCGWTHFNCSGLENKTDYHENFLCAKCSKNRVIIEDDDLFAVACTKIHNAYTNPKKSMAFGSRQNLFRATECSPKHVDRNLNSSETYTKLKLSRKRFPRLKVVSYRLNEIWSIDLADMQQLATEKSGVRDLFAAVDTLNRFLWVTGLKSKTSRACTGALKEYLQQRGNGTLQKFVQRSISRKKFGLIKVKNLPVTLHSSATRMAYKLTLQEARQNLPWLRDTLKH